MLKYPINQDIIEVLSCHQINEWFTFVYISSIFLLDNDVVVMIISRSRYHKIGDMFQDGQYKNDA